MPSCWNTPTPAWWVHLQLPWLLFHHIVFLKLIGSVISVFPLQYLSCLTTSRSLTDKLAFDVGLQEDSTGDYEHFCSTCPSDSDLGFFFFFKIFISTTGEACWWTIHPASKQRSEGEKVRVGDDLILVSVSSERYLVTTTAFTCIKSQSLQSVLLILPSALFAAPVLCQWWFNGRCFLHANSVDHDPCNVWMWTSWRYVIFFLLKTKQNNKPNPNLALCL